MRRMQVTVIGESEAGEENRAHAMAIGRMLAECGCVIVTGGGGGIMEAAAQGAEEAGGLTVGILPSANFEDANPWTQVVLPTGMAHARNALTVLAGDLVVAVGGGAGTLSEIAFAWMNGKRIVLWKGSGGWSDRLGPGPLDHRRGPFPEVCSTLDELRHIVQQVQAERFTGRGS